MRVPKDEFNPSTPASAVSQVSEDDFVIVSDGESEPISSVRTPGSSVSERGNNPKGSGKAPAAESQILEEDFVIVSRERKFKPPIEASGSSISEQVNNPTVSGRVPAAFTNTKQDRETPTFLRELLRPRIHEKYEHPAHRVAGSSNENTEPSDRSPTLGSAGLDFNPHYPTMLHYMLHMYQVDEKSLLEIKCFFVKAGYSFPSLFILGVVGVFIRPSPWPPRQREALAKHCISKRLQVFNFILEMYRKGKPEEEILEVCFSDEHLILDSARMGHNDEDPFGDEVRAYRASRRFVRDLLFFAKIQKD